MLLADEVTFLRDYLALEQLRSASACAWTGRSTTPCWPTSCRRSRCSPWLRTPCSTAWRRARWRLRHHPRRTRSRLGRAWPQRGRRRPGLRRPPASMHLMPTAAKALACGPSQALLARLRRPRPSEHPHRPRRRLSASTSGFHKHDFSAHCRRRTSGPGRPGCLGGRHAGLRLVARCSDGDEALAQIRAHRPALVLTDIQMPGMTGLMCCAPCRTSPSWPAPASSSPPRSMSTRSRPSSCTRWTTCSALCARAL